ncbi:anhydro-N-acetylmuramic acid kinase [Brucella sp. BO3]|uniref:anhydro-N-acetylmuramic acid kinase n=1 Tax=unclassified Brucella TaxID=2632610 RepID=UPI00084F8D45|nr:MULTISPECIES: anhydro-N-acetylmuramic acid kinase [unclassified Brucella]OEI82639.1 anhydro-N-acetylmuramic acid kinase [Brucella sp. B13-0095]QMV26181.1 anhydro-N-acetylmuramic acid kinase [Brucella sp. BO3]
MPDLKRAIGLMSGTSMDGIDIALLATDGENWIERGASASMDYSDGFRARLKAGLVDARAIKDRAERPGLLRQLEHDLTLLHAVAVHDFLHEQGLQPHEIDVIGFHGQTVLHRPNESLTVQIGDGALLARETGIPVVYDMRAEDMRHGGQGAPLIPAYHAALAANLPLGLKGPVVFVNIGGISNLTYVGEDGALIAYDSGPGNMLIDQWMELHGHGRFDPGGATAMSGSVDRNTAHRYLEHEFFKGNHRRSLDRGDFTIPAKGELNLADGARTLAFVSAAAILKSASHLPARPRTYVVSGGGRKNGALMDELTALAEREGAHVIDADNAGFDGDAMEAEAWAYLAVRSLCGLPLTYPSTTGCDKPVSGGVPVNV